MSSHDNVGLAEVPLQRSSLALTVFVAVVCALPCAAAGHAHHAAAKARVASHTVSSHTVSRHAATGRAATRYVSTHASHGRLAQRVAVVHHDAAPAMDSTRATAIQAALIRAGYLSGEPTGVWDAGSIAAMQKLQDANGWQTKYTPDSRALVKLGLGSAPSLRSPSSAPASSAAESASAASTIQP